LFIKKIFNIKTQVQYKLTTLNFLTCVNLHMLEKLFLYILVKESKSRKIVLETYIVIFDQLIITTLFNKILHLLTA